ncbi:NUDIX hydrolase [uncultured Tateyamaria sp.]|uniref:NUDIX hydrolase n=1 Tax=uncultured Tateyamaria sp. TaxID=455651 RepID=UPI002620EE62|nr:NUDIX hydrolase [uncultured Tateyamaria sp.]
MIKQLPLNLGRVRKADVRTQFAALCYRVKKDKVQVLLVTSRRMRRWIIPKGWPMDGLTPADSAAQEAWEEGGVVGRADQRALGMFTYSKDMGEDAGLPIAAMVYAVKVKSLAMDFPEAAERTRKWVSPRKAAKMVDSPELSRILRDFDPRFLA